MTEDAQAFYGRWARLYDLLARKTPGIVALRQRAADACRLEPGDTVVEMGCGTGANLPFFRSAVGPEGTVIGIDFTAPVLERARELTAQYDNVHVIRGDATAPPVSGPVDAVLATFVVGMLSNPAGAVEDWTKFVGSGGHVVLVNAARSDRWYSPPVNALFHAITVLSTPPTTKLRYETAPTRRLDERIRHAHDALRENADAVAHETHVLGVVRLTGGRIA
ncbi:type 11 methyltransferase [Halostagnicola larsenii XH-48]|uniref:Type 11 methyltransferase n=1 Tax=Halostagnicola larsenii XH-48 TaxID=797299 RepID=W0JKN4_9EURY|nr:methyltransferase domain-containing protein [Halostagnicola larsenii]AHF99168.1 type 11 methyltransferase [Halostagnicola larsenii XH-48]